MTDKTYQKKGFFCLSLNKRSPEESWFFLHTLFLEKEAQIDQNNYGMMLFMSKQVSLPKISWILQKMKIGWPTKRYTPFLHEGLQFVTNWHTYFLFGVLWPGLVLGMWLNDCDIFSKIWAMAWLSFPGMLTKQLGYMEILYVNLTTILKPCTQKFLDAEI